MVREAGRGLKTRWAQILWLTLVWVLLWGELSVGNVLAGVLLGVLLTRLLPLPPVEFNGRARPVASLALLARFIVDVVIASIQVSYLALRWDRPPRGAVLRVQLRSHSDLYLTLTAELASLVPGSIIVEAHRLTGTLYVHVLDVEVSGGVEKARESVLAQERRVLYALASDAEIADAGLPPRRSAARRAARAGSQVSAP